MEENTGVNQEVATPSTEATDRHSSHEVSSAATDDSNWKEAREVMRQQQLKIQELENQIKNSGNNGQAQNDFDELDSLASDDIVTVEQARRLAEKIAQRTATEISSSQSRELRKLEVVTKHPDFYSVVSDENVRKLEKEHPAIAEGIAKSDNPYKGAYEVIKALYKGQDEGAAAAKLAEENLSKPRSVHSQGHKGPLSEAAKFESQALTADRRAEIWKMAQQYAAGR